jgi:hypothetical protein
VCLRRSMFNGVVAKLDFARTRHAVEYETVLSRMVARSVPLLVANENVRMSNFVQTITHTGFTFWENDEQSKKWLDMQPAFSAAGARSHP